MKCCQCKKEVDKQFFEHIKNLPPMTGYNCPPSQIPVAECANCKKPVCGKCIRGHGLAIYTCKGECTDKFIERTSS